MSRGRPTPNPAVEDASGTTPGTTCLRSVLQKQSPRRRSRCTWFTGAVLSGEGVRKAVGEGVASANPTTRGLIRGCHRTVSFTSESCFSSDKGSRLISPLQPWTTGCPGWGQAAPRHLLARQLCRPRAPLAKGAGVRPQQLGDGHTHPPRWALSGSPSAPA